MTSSNGNSGPVRSGAGLEGVDYGPRLTQAPAHSDWEALAGSTPPPEAPAARENHRPKPAAKAAKPQLVEPPGVPIPQEGRARLHYWLNRKLNREDKWQSGCYLVPKLGKKEQAKYDAWQEEQRQEAEQLRKQQFKQSLIDRLRYLAALGVQPILAFSNIKSASKTTAAIYVGSVIAEYTRKNVLLLPATTNTATSTAGLMSGINEGNFITVSEYSRNIKEYGAFRTLSSRVPRTKFGLGVIVEDTNSDAGDVDNSEFRVNEFREALKTTLPNVDVLILDLGNDNIAQGSIALEAVRQSHVVNFPFITDSPITQITLGRTIAGYNTDTHLSEELGDGVLSGSTIPTREKVRRSVVIASKASEEDFVDFDMLTRPAIQDVHAELLKKWDGIGLKVPADAYIGQLDEQGNVSKCDLHEIQPETLDACLEVAVANFEIAAHFQSFNLQDNPGYTDLVSTTHRNRKGQRHASVS